MHACNFVLCFWFLRYFGPFMIVSFKVHTENTAKTITILKENIFKKKSCGLNFFFEQLFFKMCTILKRSNSGIF